MRSYLNLAILALAASTISPALTAPTQYRYESSLVKFKGQAFLISRIPTLGRIPILLTIVLMLVTGSVPNLPLTIPLLPLPKWLFPTSYSQILRVNFFSLRTLTKK